MAKPSKAERLGTYVKKIGYFDIRQKIVKANTKRNIKKEGWGFNMGRFCKEFNSKFKISGMVGNDYSINMDEERSFISQLFT